MLFPRLNDCDEMIEVDTTTNLLVKVPLDEIIPLLKDESIKELS